MSHELPRAHEYNNEPEHEEHVNGPNSDVRDRKSDNYAHIHSHRALIGFDENGIPTITHRAEHHEEDDDPFGGDEEEDPFS